jgi:hypothetical protein
MADMACSCCRRGPAALRFEEGEKVGIDHVGMRCRAARGDCTRRLPRSRLAFDAKWGNFVIDPSFFTKLVYEGV